MKFGFFVGVLLVAVSFTSCKKDYTCTCTSVGSISSTKSYDLQNQNYADAQDACERFEADANNGGLGTTACHL